MKKTCDDRMKNEQLHEKLSRTNRSRAAENMERITVKDIARALNVSLSTVNKGLTGKPGISEKRRAEILDTAKRMGYTANRAAQSLARNQIKLGIVLPGDWPQYHDSIKSGILYAMARLRDYNVTGEVRCFSTVSGQSSEDCIADLCNDGVNGIIFCPDIHNDTASALQAAYVRHIPVVTIELENPAFPVLSNIEVDASICGRLAAELLEITLPPDNEAAVILGSVKYPLHIRKAEAFRSRLEEKGHIYCSDILETEDSSEEAYKLTKKLLSSHPHLCGIYVATAVSDGVCHAVVESGMKENIRIIATDMHESVQQYMEQGIILASLYQNTFLQGVQSVGVMYKYLSDAVIPSEQYLLSPQLILKSNYSYIWKEQLMTFDIMNL